MGNREKILHSAALMQVIRSHKTHYLSDILNSNSFTFWQFPLASGRLSFFTSDGGASATDATDHRHCVIITPCLQ